jgi:hypothetical protein
MKDKIEILQEAIGTGEIIKIKYNGGSQPGTVREIIPRKIDREKEMIYAYCITSSKILSFSLSKIEISSYDENITYRQTQKMSETDISVLKKALKDEKTIKIRYNRGSQPGTVREIIPKKIDEDYMEAHCIMSDEDLTFNMLYVELASESDTVNYLNRENFYIFSRFQEKLKETYDNNKEKWKQLSWSVEYNNSVIGIRFDGKDDGQADIFILFEGSREKPCIVQCKGKNSYFKDADGAIKKFLGYCENPNTQKAIIRTQSQPLVLVEEPQKSGCGLFCLLLLLFGVIFLGNILF